MVSEERAQRESCSIQISELFRRMDQVERHNLENQEHLELGLQLLATRALSAVLALPAAGDRGTCLSVLLLPKITTVSPAEMLVIPSGAVHEQFRNLVLVVENENINVREVRSTQLDERNSHIEVFSIEADPGIRA